MSFLVCVNISDGHFPCNTHYRNPAAFRISMVDLSLFMV